MPMRWQGSRSGGRVTPAGGRATVAGRGWWGVGHAQQGAPQLDELAALLCEHTEAAGISIAEVARRTGFRPFKMWAILNAIQPPSVKDVRLLAEAIGMNPAATRQAVERAQRLRAPTSGLGGEAPGEHRPDTVRTADRGDRPTAATAFRPNSDRSRPCDDVSDRTLRSGPRLLSP
ncbi:helix-turn-helix domain-containing protein [Nocardia sp. NRRL S-836]|uniref:helix-turn-helix domain-containing protein n=1 Tax=Nocardia sp. NRRL S-836 TaxID=1519492 RepID=UPI0035105056